MTISSKKLLLSVIEIWYDVNYLQITHQTLIIAQIIKNNNKKIINNKKAKIIFLH